MKRVWGQVAAGVSLLAGGIIVMAACVHDDSTLFVQDVLQAPFVTQGQQCEFTNDPTQPFISQGVLDVALRSEYTAEFLLANQMVAEGNSQQLQTETSTITVQGAVVRITNAAGVQLNTFTRLAAATVYPSSGTTPGYAPIGLTILDAATVQQDQDLQGTINAGGTARLVTYVKFFGNTLGGKSVESDEFEFPVDVCKGCLVSFSPISGPQCLTAACSTGSATTSLPSPCVPGQDFAVDCSLCLSNPVCNPTGAHVQPDGGCP